MNYRKLSLILAVYLCPLLVFSKDQQLSSPDGKIKVTVSVDQQIRWSVHRGSEQLLKPSAIALHTNQVLSPGIKPVWIKTAVQAHKGMVTAVVAVKSKDIVDEYNELRMEFKGGYSVLFRAYNNGVAYRFETALASKEIEIKAEQADFNFSDNYKVFWPEEKDPDFQSHYESLYKDSVVAAFPADAHAALPMLLVTSSGTKMLISESDLYDYPNLFLFGTKGNALTAGFPKVILESVPVRDRTNKITKLAGYIAKTTGKRVFPWRSIAICVADKELLENNLTYQLASPSVLKNTEWIKPGKVAWDWWNDNNIYGVNFKSGINTATYKYYIDFAADYGLEYIMLDEGWTKTTTDLMHPHAAIDIQEIIDYGKSKNVGVWLWTLWGPLDKDMESILALYKKWGAAGIKVDFMARADQYMVNFYERVAATAAKHELMVDLHGAYKPVGLNRKYPNVLSYEGVRGLENCKWSADITPEHDVTLPFIRMAAGPMDFTPGAMLNASKKDFKINFSSPMSMGTRAHQVAMYVLYESPLQMLADNPSNYRKDSICTRFISRIPTTWDKTLALDGKVGAYAVIARKHGNKWYISAMGDNQKRNFNIPLNFLDGNPYSIDVLSDGINADRHAADYQISHLKGDKNTTLSINLEQGGGYCAILSPVN
jgi:alpha-glucosidase